MSEYIRKMIDKVKDFKQSVNENYNKAPRRGVFVNLNGNSPPSATTEITSIISRLRREGWTLGLQA